jgi:hypothetical protein
MRSFIPTFKFISVTSEHKANFIFNSFVNILEYISSINTGSILVSNSNFLCSFSIFFFIFPDYLFSNVQEKWSSFNFFCNLIIFCMSTILVFLLSFSMNHTSNLLADLLFHPEQYINLDGVILSVLNIVLCISFSYIYVMIFTPH